VVRHRPAARIVCVDAEHRILLLKWRDPSDGTLLWEPPGGGIEPGETPYDTACRELFEETGLPAESVSRRSVDVERDVWWNGQHFMGPEPFFLARVTDTAVAPQGLVEDEPENFVDLRWFRWEEIGALEARLEPPQLHSVLIALVPDGPWARVGEADFG